MKRKLKLPVWMPAWVTGRYRPALLDDPEDDDVDRFPSHGEPYLLESHDGEAVACPWREEPPLNQYSDDWTAISKEYRATVGWRCENCDKDFWERPDLLHTHHIDHCKGNNAEWNLQAFCKPCHEAVHGRKFD